VKNSINNFSKNRNIGSSSMKNNNKVISSMNYNKITNMLKKKHINKLDIFKYYCLDNINSKYKFFNIDGKHMLLSHIKSLFINNNYSKYVKVCNVKFFSTLEINYFKGLKKLYIKNIDNLYNKYLIYEKNKLKTYLNKHYNISSY
jgi:hypothetical protein